MGEKRQICGIPADPQVMLDHLRSPLCERVAYLPGPVMSTDAPLRARR
jgi:hypothetical protein